ncbi:SGNH/GDSL hydrolase family protein [Bacillus xiapuensis]|uniref:SGNH/GDSL hydrolase family protein n=1 Tax=Bacillus xiapuensis TaxID=2014075 RepID=UPI000C24013C|nr:SGNH/GDSL hydrolase family protein [Bacillus xiapuensis]
MSKRMYLHVLVILFAAASFWPVNAEASDVHYRALGDSLAAGQTPNKEIGAGYADMIALALQQSGRLDSFSKQWSFPGYTTEQVLQRLSQEAVRQDLQNASLITISAGANDVLPLIKNDHIRGTLSYEAIPVAFALNRVRENYGKILRELERVSPGAEVYAMGYYFPYPHVREQLKPAAGKQMSLLNQVIQQEAEKAGAHFVSVEEAFGSDADRLIPNRSDVHPAPQGYWHMANQFLHVYTNGAVSLPKAVLKTLPKPVPLSKMRQETEEEEEKQENRNRANAQPITAAHVKGCDREGNVIG